jgi:AraC-like DNA-binding protein
VPAHLNLQDTFEVRAKLELWELGDGTTTLMRRHSTGLALSRTARQVRASAPERLALTLLSPGAWTYNHRRTDHTPAPGQHRLLLVNHADPYQYRRTDEGTTVAVNFDAARLDLPMAALSTAASSVVPQNPLHDLLRDHVHQLARLADTHPDALTVLDEVTIQLVRALVSIAIRDTHRVHESLERTLLFRIRHYIRANLADSTLTPERIARAHNISVRHLYQVWSATQFTLSQWIIQQRLALARELLSDPQTRNATIAAIARRSGFRDPTHFTRRFRDAYGVTPREWRRAATPGAW